jgi:high affinity sulfate transporter 1
MTRQGEDDPPVYRRGRSPFRPPARRPLLARLVPVSERLAGYRGDKLRRDLLAGVTVAALALPAAMAYGELAGLTAIDGLYTLLLPAVAYTLLGSSRQLIIGPEGSIAAMVAAAVIPLAADDPQRAAALASLLALLVGAVYVVARLIRLGWIADYFSQAVLLGYLHGVAVVLVIGQLGKLAGITPEAEGPLPTLADVLRRVGEFHRPTVAVGVASLVVLLVLRWRLRRFPGPLVVVVAAIIASAALDLAADGVAVVGDIPSGLPSVRLPGAGLDDAVALLPAALGIFFVSYSDEILTARSFAGRRGEHVRADTELGAMGVASLAAGVTQGFPIGASGSRTAVNDQMGVRSQLSGLYAAAVIALVLLFLTAPMEYLPKATLGAVIVAAAIGIVNPGAWRGLARTSRVEVAIAAVTMAGVILVGVLEALLLAVALSIVDVVRRSAIPHDAVLGWDERMGRYADVSVHRRAQITPGVLVYRLDDRLFFANAGYVAGRIHEAVNGNPTPVRWLVFDGEALSHLDATGTGALEELIRSFQADGVAFVFARIKTPMHHKLEEAGIVELVGPDHLYPTVRAAVAACPAAAPGSPSAGDGRPPSEAGP